MVNRPKQIGTATETAVVRYLQSVGIPAERKPLAGADDVGDLWSYSHGIVPHPALIWEVKGGAAAENASDSLIADWIGETERERIAADAQFGILVRKRARKGSLSVHSWWAHMTLNDLAWLSTNINVAPKTPHTIVTMTLEDAAGMVLAARLG